MNQRLRLIVTLGLAALLVAAVPASAQLLPGQGRLLPGQSPQRPNGGLFGGGVGKIGQGLEFNGSLGAGFDDDLLNRSAVGTTQSGPFSTGRAFLTYRVTHTALTAALSVSAAGRYYPDLRDPMVATYFADGVISGRPSSKTTISGSYHVGRYLRNLAFFYNDPLAAGNGSQVSQTSPIDPGTFADTYLSFRSDVLFQQDLTRLFSLYGHYSYYVNDVSPVAGSSRYASQSAGAGMVYTLAKGLGLRLGYSLTGAANFGGGPAAQSSYQSRTIDAGIDFNKTLSLTRQATLGFSTGLAGVNDQTTQTRYYFIGHVDFTHELGRSWSFNANVRRSVEFDQTFGQPVFADTLNAGVSGLLSHRLEANVNFGAVRGTIGVSTAATRYNAANLGAGLQYGFTKALAVSVRYALYYYDFANGSTPLPGLLSKRERQSVTVTLNAWVPLLTSRRLNASR